MIGAPGAFSRGKGGTIPTGKLVRIRLLKDMECFNMSQACMPHVLLQSFNSKVLPISNFSSGLSLRLLDLMDALSKGNL
jgi:hypothetical protein